MTHISMWTDGGCKPNPGRGGWGVILEAGGRKKMLSGRIDGMTTSQRAELTALINGLQALRHGPHDVTLYTDSEYVRLAVKGMKKPKMNHDLLRRITELVAMHRVTVRHISGHAGNENNEKCDLLAGAEIEA